MILSIQEMALGILSLKSIDFMIVFNSYSFFKTFSCTFEVKSALNCLSGGSIAQLSFDPPLELRVRMLEETSKRSTHQPYC